MDGVLKVRAIADFRMPQKKNLQQLTQTTENYRILFENSNNAILVSKVTNGIIGNIIAVNLAACKLLGYTKKEFLQLSIYDIDLHFDTKMLQKMATQTVYDDHRLYETTYVSKNTDHIPIETHMSACIFDRRPAVISFARDIRKQKKLEDHLRQSEQEFKALAENSPDVIIRCDKNFHLVYANPAIEIPTGISAQDIIGTHLDDLGLEGKYHRLWKVRIRKVFATKKGITFQSEIKTPLKTSFYYHAHFVPEFAQDGSVQYVLCTLRNITDLKEAEQALKKNQDRTQVLLDSIPDILFIIDRRGIILDFQASKKTFAPFISKNLQYKNICDVFPSVAPTIMNSFEQALINNRMQFFEFQTTFKSATSHCEGRVTANNDNEFMLIIREISELKKLQQHLARFDRLHLVGEMAVSIAHEIRNPMTTVRGFLQMFHKNPDFQYYEDFLDVMISEIDHANTIISEFILLSKNKALTLVSQNLNTTIIALIPLLQTNANVINKQVIVKLDYVPNLKLDNKEIRQLILNLANNGLEAMPAKSKLHIQTYIEQKKVVLAINDKGTGIAPEFLEKIATPFFTTKEGHSGLGLAICYNIAARHNAEITFDTSPLGTTFYVKFAIS